MPDCVHGNLALGQGNRFSLLSAVFATGSPKLISNYLATDFSVAGPIDETWLTTTAKRRPGLMESSPRV